MKAILIFVFSFSYAASAKYGGNADIKEIACFEELDKAGILKGDSSQLLKRDSATVVVIPDKHELGYYQYTKDSTFFCRPGTEVPIAESKTKQTYHLKAKAEGVAFYLVLERVMHKSKETKLQTLANTHILESDEFSENKGIKNLAETYKPVRCDERQAAANLIIKNSLDARLKTVGELMKQEWARELNRAKNNIDQAKLKLSQSASRRQLRGVLQVCDGTLSHQIVQDILLVLVDTSDKSLPPSYFKPKGQSTGTGP